MARQLTATAAYDYALAACEIERWQLKPNSSMTAVVAVDDVSAKLQRDVVVEGVDAGSLTTQLGQLSAELGLSLVGAYTAPQQLPLIVLVEAHAKDCLSDAEQALLRRMLQAIAYQPAPGFGVLAGDAADAAPQALLLLLVTGASLDQQQAAGLQQQRWWGQMQSFITHSLAEVLADSSLKPAVWAELQRLQAQAKLSLV